MKSAQVDRLGKTFPIKQNFADSLFEWGVKFARMGLVAEGGAAPWGSLSYRHALGFVITRQGADPEKLMDGDLIFVERWDFKTGRFTCRGQGELPEESFLHALIYQNRGGAIFTFHIRDREMEKTSILLGLPSIKEEGPLSDPALMSEFTEKLGIGNLIALPRQGIFSFGCTAEDAGEPLGVIHGKSHS